MKVQLNKIPQNSQIWPIKPSGCRQIQNAKLDSKTNYFKKILLIYKELQIRMFKLPFSSTVDRQLRIGIQCSNNNNDNDNGLIL